MVSIPATRIAQITARHDELSAEMARPDLAPEKFVALAKEYAELTAWGVRGTANERRRMSAIAAVVRGLL